MKPENNPISKPISSMLVKYLSSKGKIHQEETEFIDSALSFNSPLLWESKISNDKNTYFESLDYKKQEEPTLFEFVFQKSTKPTDKIFNKIYDNYSLYVKETTGNIKKDIPWKSGLSINKKLNELPVVGWSIIYDKPKLLNHLLTINEGTENQWDSLINNPTMLRFALSTKWRKIEKHFLNNTKLKNNKLFNYFVNELAIYRKNNIWINAKKESDLPKDIKVSPEQGLKWWKKISRDLKVFKKFEWQFDFLLNHEESWNKWNEEEWQKFWQVFDDKKGVNFFYSIVECYENKNYEEKLKFNKFLKKPFLNVDFENTKNNFYQKLMMKFLFQNITKEKKLRNTYRNINNLSLYSMKEFVKKQLLSHIKNTNLNNNSLLYLFINESINKNPEKYNGLSKSFLLILKKNKLLDNLSFKKDFFLQKEYKDNELLTFINKKYTEKVPEIEATYTLSFLHKNKLNYEKTKEILQSISHNNHCDRLLLEQLFDRKTLNIKLFDKSNLNKEMKKLYYNFLWETLIKNNDVFQRKWLKRMKNHTSQYDFSVPINENNKNKLKTMVEQYKKTRGKRIKEDSVFVMFQKVLLQVETQVSLLDKEIKENTTPVRKRKM